MHDVDRALAFEDAWLRALATSIDPVHVGGRRVGDLVLTATVPRIRDHNVVVLDPAPDLDADAAAALLDHELGRHGHAHRRLRCRADDADRWHDRLVDGHGYTRADTVVMRWPGGAPDLATPDHATPDLAAPGVTVTEADRATATRVVRHVLGALPGAEPAVVEELVTLAGMQHDRGARMFVAAVEGTAVGAVRLFADDGIAQVEELEVHPRSRRLGVGRTLLAAALRAARDRRLVFLTSDPDDWPTAWYSRLGLQVVGRSSGFVRLPPADAA